MELPFVIKSTRDVAHDGIKLLIHAKSGTGKTTLAGTMPGKSLILNAENGTAVLRDKDIDVIDVAKKDTDPHSLFQLEQIYVALRDGHLKYDNVILDSLTEISEWIMSDLKNDAYFGDNKNTFAKWDEFKLRLTELVKAFRDLKGFNVFFITLSEPVEINSMQVMMPMVPHKKTQAKLMALFDECLFMDSDLEGKRHIHSSETSTYVAKSRYGITDGTDICDLSELYKEHIIIKEGN